MGVKERNGDAWKRIPKMKVVEGENKEALYLFLIKSFPHIFTFCGSCAVQWMAPPSYQFGKLQKISLSFPLYLAHLFLTSRPSHPLFAFFLSLPEEKCGIDVSAGYSSLSVENFAELFFSFCAGRHYFHQPQLDQCLWN